MKIILLALLISTTASAQTSMVEYFEALDPQISLGVSAEDIYNPEAFGGPVDLYVRNLNHGPYFLGHGFVKPQGFGGR